MNFHWFLIKNKAETCFEACFVNWWKIWWFWHFDTWMKLDLIELLSVIPTLYSWNHNIITNWWILPLFLIKLPRITNLQMKRSEALFHQHSQRVGSIIHQLFLIVEVRNSIVDCFEVRNHDFIPNLTFFNAKINHFHSFPTTMTCSNH